MLVDSHCHLNFDVFEGKLDSVIKEANDNDVRLLQTICTKMEEFDAILSIAQKYPHIFCSVGLHPNNVGESRIPSEAELLEKTKHPKVIGIGETGLDYYYDHAPRELQQTSFRTHINVARESGLPVIIHARDADDDIITILQDEYSKGAFPGLIHCFSSTEALALAAIEIGFYVSIAGIVTFKNAKTLQEIVTRLPLEKLLVETDAPYLAPVPFRGKTNQPAYTRHTAEYIAKLKEVDYQTVAETTTRNFFDLFQKAYYS